MILHDSHDMFFRNPVGAVPYCEKIVIRLKVDADLLTQSVILRTWWADSGEQRFDMLKVGRDNNSVNFEAHIKAPEKPGLLWYYFIIKSLDKIFFYGNNAERLGGIGKVYEYPPDSYQITVYKRGFETPGWFKESIMYQIFVDRFYNGNADGSITDIKAGAIIHEKWDDIPSYKPDPQTGKYLNNDYFGGNLLGIIKKLPYLKELGVNVIYLNPIFEASSNHKYNTGNYLKVDPMFGNDKLFKELCASAKKQGISIILDGVFSHTGSDSVYFNKEGRYPSLGAYQSKESPYYPWYTFTKYPDAYECWWGVESLPDVNELDSSYQDFILYNEDSAVKHWMMWGCRGWRLDVADELPDEFLKNLRQVVKKVDSEAVIIGEVWEDASNKISYGKMREYLLGEQLDSVMNYPLREAIIKFFTCQWDGEMLNRSIMTLYENYPLTAFYSMMNLLGSHDTVRIKSVLGGYAENMYYGEQEARYTLSEEQRILALKRLRMAALFQMTFPGVPCIYYGDEAGLEGGKDPFCRGTYPWGREDIELIEWYKKVIAMRNSFDALRTGQFVPVYHKRSVYGFVRLIRDRKDVFGQEKNDGCALALFNSSIQDSYDIDVDLSLWSAERLFDVLNNDIDAYLDKGHLIIKLMPLEGKLFLSKAAKNSLKIQ